MSHSKGSYKIYISRSRGGHGYTKYNAHRKKKKKIRTLTFAGTSLTISATSCTLADDGPGVASGSDSLTDCGALTYKKNFINTIPTRLVFLSKRINIPCLLGSRQLFLSLQVLPQAHSGVRVLIRIRIRMLVQVLGYVVVP